MKIWSVSNSGQTRSRTASYFHMNPVLEIRKFRVREIVWETPTTYTLSLSPEKPDDRLIFQAGQWAYLHLFNEDGSTWARASYSIASAPSESKEVIQITIKIRGDFTKRASKLQPDDLVGIQGPFGVFTIKPEADPIVMFAGGIGITPLRCMIRELFFRGQHNRVVLFYSNRDHEEATFFEEFDDLSERWPEFIFVPTLTGQHVPARWKGETGRITVEHIKKYAPDISQADMLMCGPTVFMDAITSMLQSMGIDTKKQLRKELFGT